MPMNHKESILETILEVEKHRAKFPKAASIIDYADEIDPVSNFQLGFWLGRMAAQMSHDNLETLLRAFVQILYEKVDD